MDWKHWSVAAAAIGGLIVGLSIGRADIMNEEIVRGWVGALSGWVAAAAAVITITYVSRQTILAENAYHEERSNKSSQSLRARNIVFNWALEITNSVAQEKEQRLAPHLSTHSYEELSETILNEADLSERESLIFRNLNAAVRSMNEARLSSVNIVSFMQTQHKFYQCADDAAYVVSTLRILG